MTICREKPGPKPRQDRSEIRRPLRIVLPPILIAAMRQLSQDRRMPVSRAFEEAAGLWISYQKVFRQ